MTRVLLVLEATEGGTLTHLRDLVLGLDPAEFELTVAVGVSRGPGAEADLERFRRHGATVLVGPLQRAVRPLTDLRALLWLRRIIAAGRYDLVHAHSSKAGLLARLAARMARVPSLYTPNGWSFLNAEFTPWRQRLFAALERRAARWSRFILPVSAGEMQAALDWGITTPDRLITARNGIDLAELRRATPLTRAELGLASDALVAVTIGRRAAQKGDRYLLSAWQAMVATHPRAILLLIGDGPLEAELRAQADALGIADSVRFLGRVPRADVYLPLADLFVLPSLFEGCPYALMEAMALGRACVATAVQGSAELIESGVTGLLVEPADSDALAQALLRLAGDEELRAGLGRAASRFADEQLDVRRQVEQVAEVYRRVAAGGEARSTVASGA